MRSLALVLVFVPGLLSAQSDPPLTPYFGLAAGATRFPEPLVERCGDNPGAFVTAEARAGVGRGSWKAEIRGDVSTSGIASSCMTGPIVHESGVHTDRHYSHERRHGGGSVIVQLSHAPERAYWTVGVGAGRLTSAGVPFLAGSVSLRTRGRFAGTFELQGRLHRLQYDLVTATWEQFVRQSVLSSEARSEWHGGLGIRAGWEYTFR